jgi:hypothetical protein
VVGRSVSAQPGGVAGFPRARTGEKEARVLLFAALTIGSLSAAALSLAFALSRS